MAFCSFPSGTDNFTPHQRIMHRLSLGRGTAITRVDVLPPDHGDGWILKIELNHDHHDDIANRVIFDRIDENVSLTDATEEAIDRYDLPACRDDFGVDTREGWAIWERAEDGYKPTLTTKDGLTVYDLDPQSSELWAVAGPAGFKKGDIDTDNLPEGFRWVTTEEWEGLVFDGD